MRIATEILIGKYRDSVFALSFCICKDREDADDVVQEVFVKYHFSGKEFESERHIRSWLCKVAVNLSRNRVKCFWRSHKESIEEYKKTLSFGTEEDGELFSAVMSLPRKYRTALHLHYFEGYSVKEISKMLGISESNAKARLSRGRKALKSII
ncbi:MAG: sigma-70 family RNA polymerase sigma factor [Bacteroidales bacterium]|nr:sigma-70 family RNA polymerase sigma factor [Bacteroidales bacterium]MBQ9174685.1 sigma-70 family RNA polymerase sigma factor [Bacteroidales bacterium]MBQ9712960.1 sigma-70 family RNA polymerase sigma factor [Bacteroidales bacterium]